MDAETANASTDQQQSEEAQTAQRPELLQNLVVTDVADVMPANAESVQMAQSKPIHDVEGKITEPMEESEPLTQTLHGSNPAMDPLAGFRPVMVPLADFQSLIDLNAGYQPSMDPQAGYQPSMQSHAGYQPSMDRPPGHQPTSEEMYNKFMAMVRAKTHADPEDVEIWSHILSKCYV